MQADVENSELAQLATAAICNGWVQCMYKVFIFAIKFGHGGQ
jgi:hypothetical protein